MDNQAVSRWAKIIAGVLVILFLLALSFNEAIINFSLSYLILYKYTTLFVVVFLAGLCVPIPMNILLMAIGALTIAGQFNFIYSLLLASVANTIGDVTAVLIFRKWGHALVHEQFMEKYSFFTRLEQFFSNHINLSIFVSRLIGIFGTPVNFLSGYLKIPISRFAIYDYIGNFVFALSFLELGFVVGDRWLTVSEFVTTAMTIISVVLVFSVLTFLFKNGKKQVTQ